MVWDPDKSEYVPLVVVKTSEPKKTADGRRQTAGKEASVPPKPEKRQERRHEKHVEKPTEKPTEKPIAKSKEERPPKPPKQHDQPRPPKPPHDKKPERTDVHREEKVQREEKVPREDRQRERPPRHGDSRRSQAPKFVESSQPDPADIESEVSGFADLGVSEAMLEALKIVGYLEPTPIQAGVFQKVRAGTDLMGQAQTGTGKTAAFSMPIIDGVEMCPPGNAPVALILVPTRELAVQVRDEAIRLAYGRDVRIAACYGGKPLAKQIERLRSGIDVLVGTPGRILDLMNRRALVLDSLRWVVLDEADRMLDIGFRPDIEKILKRTPQERQTLLFSATLPPPVVRLAEKYMKSPEVLDFSSKSVAVETIEQFYVTVDPERKFDALVHLLKEQEPQQAIIFTRTKRGADRLARLLSNRFEKLAAIHGDLQQNERDRVMGQFRSGSVRYLVATDVVGRGIDVSGISHIINYDVPKFCDDYIHRVGRTGRMGREGIAFTFVTAQEGSELTRIEMRIDKLLKRAELKGFESFTKPHDPDASLDDDLSPEPPKPIFGKPIRKVRRAL
jgi:ATP-dependent RNA helicase DeaD